MGKAFGMEAGMKRAGNTGSQWQWEAFLSREALFLSFMKEVWWCFNDDVDNNGIQNSI